MRFKKGSKVEIFNKMEVPSGSWRCAEIICGNGHYYTVRYNDFVGIGNEKVVERVPKKDIRPCPPISSCQKWFPGDVMEAFDNFSWKMATVLGVLNRKFCLVRVVGSTRQIRVRKFEIRVRHSWKGGKWIVNGQGSGYCIDDKLDKTNVLKYRQRLSPCRRNTKAKFNVKDDCPPYKTILESQVISTESLKRGALHACSEIEVCAFPIKKSRTTTICSTCCKPSAAANQFSIPKQVDAIAYSQEMTDKIHTRASNHKIPGFDDIKVERRKQDSSPVALDMIPTSEGSLNCSVDSCSINGTNSYKFPSRFAAPLDESNNCSSDAESVVQLNDGVGNHLLPAGKDWETEVHRLELHAYRSTIGVLHASGPLSWEQEALMTNLRILLHISNDEHLMEIKDLIKSSSSSPLS